MGFAGDVGGREGAGAEDAGDEEGPAFEEAGGFDAVAGEEFGVGGVEDLETVVAQVGEGDEAVGSPADADPVAGGEGG